METGCFNPPAMGLVPAASERGLSLINHGALSSFFFVEQNHGALSCLEHSLIHRADTNLTGRAI